MTDTEKNKTVLKKANQCVTKRDYKVFLDYCTDDVKWIFVGDRTLQGKSDVLHYMESEYIEPPKFDYENFIAENDYLTVMGNITLMSADGHNKHYSYCDVWKFSNGKMAELYAYVIEKRKVKN